MEAIFAEGVFFGDGFIAGGGRGNAGKKRDREERRTKTCSLRRQFYSLAVANVTGKGWKGCVD
jgi:hypothetical protein